MSEEEDTKISKFCQNLIQQYQLRTLLLGTFKDKEHVILLNNGLIHLPPFEFTCDDIIDTIYNWNSRHSRFSTIAKPISDIKRSRKTAVEKISDGEITGDEILLNDDSKSLKVWKCKDIFFIYDDQEKNSKNKNLIQTFEKSYEKIKIYASVYKFRRIQHSTAIMFSCLKQIPQVNMGMEKLLQYIMNKAKELTSADRYSVWMKKSGNLKNQPFKNYLQAILFDGCPVEQKSHILEIGDNAENANSIAGRVALTGQIYSTKSPDIKSDNYFNSTFDISTGYITKNILCFPIKSSDNEIVGVGQLCNKKKGSCFSRFDENLATQLIELCGSTIQHVSM